MSFMCVETVSRAFLPVASRCVSIPKIIKNVLFVWLSCVSSLEMERNGTSFWASKRISVEMEARFGLRNDFRAKWKPFFYQKQWFRLFDYVFNFSLYFLWTFRCLRPLGCGFRWPVRHLGRSKQVFGPNRFILAVPGISVQKKGLNVVRKTFRRPKRGSIPTETSLKTEKCVPFIA